MMEQGLSPLFAMEDLSVFGLVEVLPRLARLRRRLDEVAAKIRAARPDLVLTIDSKAFPSLWRGASRSLRTIRRSPMWWRRRSGLTARAGRVRSPLSWTICWSFCPSRRRTSPVTVWPPPLSGTRPPTGRRAMARAFAVATTCRRTRRFSACCPAAGPAKCRDCYRFFLAAAARLRERAPDLRIVLPTVPAVAAKVRAVVDGGPDAGHRGGGGRRSK